MEIESNRYVFHRLSTLRVFLWLCLCGPIPVQAIHLDHIDLPTMSAESRLIVHGEVASTRAFYDTDRGAVMTEVKLAVAETLKAAPEPSGVVTFVIPGGVHRGVDWAGPGLPTLRTGESVLVFLEAVGGRIWPYGLPLGIFRQSESADGQMLLKRDLREAHVTDPKRRSVEVKTKLTYYDLAGFKEKVREHIGAAIHARPSMEQMHLQSDATIVGKVNSVRVNADSDRIVVTRVELRVDEVYKGDRLDSIVMEWSGGELPEVAYEVYDKPVFSKGEQALVFLKKTAGGWTVQSVESKVSGRRRSDGRFEVLLPGGRIELLEDMTFLKR